MDNTDYNDDAENDFMDDDEDHELLEQAKEHYKIAFDAIQDYQQKANTTLKFIDGDQWDNQLKMNRENAGLPSLTANMLKSFLRQITNEVRQNAPSIQIDPKDDQASEDTAEVLDGLIRTIQNESDASVAYDTAAYYAAAVGLGYFRIVSEYEDVESFDQKLVVKAIDDPRTVLLDPSHRDTAGCDANYGFVITTLSKEDYLRTYRKSKLAASVAVNGWTMGTNDWITEHEVLIAEYYYKDWSEKTLYQILDVQTGQITSTFEPDPKLIKAKLIRILKDRKVQVPVVKWCKLNDIEILEETEWPGQFIPLIPVKGDEMWVDGKRSLKGACQDAVDSQRAFNYFFSLQAELVQLAPKTPFIGEIRQFANFERLWRDANVAPNAYLPYNAISLEGTPLPPPQRQSVEVPIQAAGALCQQAHDNLKNIFGIFNDQMGDQSNAESGKAILARQQQSHTTNYHFYDNLIRAITHAGRIMVEAIPVFYDTERLVHITDVSGEKQPQMINGFDPRTNKFHDLTKGKFDVTIQTGASYATRRQEAVESMMALGAAYPNALPIMSDIMVRNMDWPGAKEIAARLHAAVPPAILQATEGTDMDPEQALQQAKVQMQQQGQQIQAMTQAMTELQHEVAFTKQELQLTKLDKKIEMTKAELDYKTDHRKMDIEEMEIEIQARLDMKKLDLEEKQLAIKASEAAADVASDIMDHHHKKAKHDHEVEIAMPVSDSEIDSGVSNLDGKLNPQ